MENERVDWVKGRSILLYNCKLPWGFELCLTAAEHESGAVKIHQFIALKLGIFNFERLEWKQIARGSPEGMKKLNKILDRYMKV